MTKAASSYMQPIISSKYTLNGDLVYFLPVSSSMIIFDSLFSKQGKDLKRKDSSPGERDAFFLTAFYILSSVPFKILLSYLKRETYSDFIATRVEIC